MNRAKFDNIANVDLNSRRRLTVLCPDELSAVAGQAPAPVLDQQALRVRGRRGSRDTLGPNAVCVTGDPEQVGRRAETICLKARRSAPGLLGHLAIDFGVNGNTPHLQSAAVGSFDDAFNPEISR